MHIDLEGKRALVTGGSSGIGAAISSAFAEAGAHVAVNYLDNADQAHALADALRARGATVLPLRADVRDAAAVESMFRRVDAEWGALDVLVNNAGIDGARAETWDTDPAEWMKVIEVNLKGAYLCAREALRRMKPRRAGVVLNISSVHEVIAWSGYSAYTASKAGLSMLAKTMGQEAAPYGIRVLCIAPGAIATPINAAVRRDEASHDDLLGKIPMGRIGAPEDVARLAVVLASEAANYMTATTVFVDGGMTAYPDFAHGG